MIKNSLGIRSQQLKSAVNARKLWQFKRHLHRSDFISALRVSNQEQWMKGADQRYCLFRLGCYLSATDGASDPQTARETVALAVSYAAQGRQQKCLDTIEYGISSLQQNKTLLIEAARGVSRYDPKLSLSLLSKIKGNYALKAALLFKIGDFAQAKAQILRGKHPRKKDLVDCYHLILANIESDPRLKLLHLNSHLEASGLKTLRLLDTCKPPTVQNLTTPETPSSPTGPLVSIVMPAYQAEKWIFHSIRSLMNQTYTNIELIIVDDGSVDETQGIVTEMARHDDRIKYIRLVRNRGAYVARNIGLDAAQGEFFTVNDADDFAHPERIERQITPLIEDSNIVFTLADLVRVGNDGVFGRKEVYPIQRLNPSSLVFRRQKVVSESGRWEEVRFGSDSEFIARLKNNYSGNQWHRLKLPLTIASSHDQSLTASTNTGNSEYGMNIERLQYIEHYTLKILKK